MKIKVNISTARNTGLKTKLLRIARVGRDTEPPHTARHDLRLAHRLATVLRQHGTSYACSSACTRGAPYVSRLAAWISRMRAVGTACRCRRALGGRHRAA